MKIDFDKSGRMLNTAARFLFQPLLDFVFPPFCHSCHVAAEAKDFPLCSNCLAALPRTQEPLIDSGQYQTLLADSLQFSHSLSAFTYSEEMQRLIHDLKYNQFPILAKPLGRVLAETCLLCELFKDIDLIVPVPLHVSRFREREYNQAECLAKPIAALTHIPLSTCALVRKRNTKQQAKCSAEMRLKNIHDAFAVRKNTGIAGKRIALVDDVMTTGGTMNECAGELLDAGAANVIAVTLVRISSI